MPWLLHGRTLGLVGVGTIGAEIAARASAFGMRVPDMPGCTSTDETLADLLANAQEALTLWAVAAIDGGDARTMAFSATWEGDAPLPTLAIGDYIALTELGTPLPPCPDNTLLRPGPDGTTYGPPIALSPGYCPLSMLFSDWDRSGRPDLRISNDRQYYTDGEEQLWAMEPGADPVAYTDADGWARLQIWGMGIASHDLTGDGYPELYLTSQGDNKLQTLTAGPAEPAYRDIAFRSGVHAPVPFTGGDPGASTAWHPEFVDVNADGFMDLYVTKGNVSDQVGYAFRTGPREWRIEFPAPYYESKLDILELRR